MPGLRCLADRLCVDRIILVPLHERLHVGRRNQPHLMSHCLQFACPVMRAAACFQRHNTCRLTGEEVEQLAPGQLATEHHRTALVGACA